MVKDRKMGYTLKINPLTTDHFKADLNISTRVVDSAVLRLAIQFEYISDEKAKWQISLLEI